MSRTIKVYAPEYVADKPLSAKEPDGNYAYYIQMPDENGDVGDPEFLPRVFIVGPEDKHEWMRLCAAHLSGLGYTSILQPEPTYADMTHPDYGTTKSPHYKRMPHILARCSILYVCNVFGVITPAMRIMIDEANRLGKDVVYMEPAADESVNAPKSSDRQKFAAYKETDATKSQSTDVDRRYNMPRGDIKITCHNPPKTMAGAACMYLSLMEALTEITARGDIPIKLECKIMFVNGEQKVIRYQDPNDPEHYTEFAGGSDLIPEKF